MMNFMKKIRNKSSGISDNRKGKRYSDSMEYMHAVMPLLYQYLTDAVLLDKLGLNATEELFTKGFKLNAKLKDSMSYEDKVDCLERATLIRDRLSCMSIDFSRASNEDYKNSLSAFSESVKKGAVHSHLDGIDPNFYCSATLIDYLKRSDSQIQHTKFEDNEINEESIDELLRCAVECFYDVTKMAFMYIWAALALAKQDMTI